MRIGEWEKRGTAESIPRFTLRNRLVLFRHESSSGGHDLSFSSMPCPVECCLATPSKMGFNRGAGKHRFLSDLACYQFNK